MLRFPVLSFDWLTLGMLMPFRHRSGAFSPIAFGAGGREIAFRAWAASRMGLDVINDRAKLIQERRTGACPVRVVVRQPLASARLSHFALKKFHYRSKHNWSIAPCTNPSLVTKQPIEPSPHSQYR